jgi:hypothetical protein
MDETMLKLSVLVAGLGSPFVVRIPRSDIVYDLKKAILGKKPNDLKHVDADRLTLWKIMTPLRIGSSSAEASMFKSTINNIKFPVPESDQAFGGDGTVQLLFLTKTLSEYWKQTPDQDNLHVIVQVSLAEGESCL